MMQLIPEKIDGAVIFTANQVCPSNETECQLCSDFAVGIHNWLLSYALNYVIVDLQDEKDVCSDLLVELIQLRKRLNIPFYFTGVMMKARRVIDTYSFGGAPSPIFNTPEDAIADLRKHDVQLTADLSKIPFGQPVPVSKPRQGMRAGIGPDGAEGSGDADGDGDGTESEMDEA